MKKFEIPEIEVSAFDVADVITTSGHIVPPGEDETPDW